MSPAGGRTQTKVRPFSKNFDKGATRIKKGDAGYGQAAAGSQTEARAKKAQEWVEVEIAKLIGVIRDRVGADDPVLAAFFSDFMNEGPLASMHHLGNPGVASRLSALMGEVVTRRPSNPQGGVPTAGWCRRSRFSSPLRAHPDESQQL